MCGARLSISRARALRDRGKASRRLHIGLAQFFGAEVDREGNRSVQKYGLDIGLFFIDGSTRGIQALLAGDLSFTEAVGTSAINGKIAGGNIAIVNGLVNTLPYYIVGHPSIKSPEDLKGRTAAVHVRGTAADFALRLALKRLGIPYNQIKAITVGGGPARIMALINGQVEFTVASDAEKFQGESQGQKTIIDMAEFKVPFQFTCTVTKMIREHPDNVQRLSRPLRRRFITSRPTKKIPSESWANIPAVNIASFWKVPMRLTPSCSLRIRIRPWKGCAAPWKCRLPGTPELPSQSGRFCRSTEKQRLYRETLRSKITEGHCSPVSKTPAWSPVF